MVNLTVKDGGGNTQVITTQSQNDGSQAYGFHYRDSTGVQVDLASKSQMAALIAAVSTPVRVETLWTDDTNTYFIRIDSGGTISWASISGSTTSAPGMGARPAAGASVLLDKSAYQAITTATGYSAGDLIDHLLTIDPNSGIVISSFWYNTTQSLLITAPSSANISPISSSSSSSSSSSAQVSGKVDTVVAGVSSDIGIYTGFSGAIISTNATTTITLTTPPTNGQIVIGDVITAAGITVGTTIVALASGTANTAGATYTISVAALTSVPSNAATGYGGRILTAANTQRRGFAIQNQTSGSLYWNAQTTPTGTFHDMLVNAGQYYETKDSYVNQGQLAIYVNTFGPVYARQW